MPTYERKCVFCRHEWEQEETVDGMAVLDQSAKDWLKKMGLETPSDESRKNAAMVCPMCGKPCGERVISKTSFILKGPGWAKDGYTK